MNRRQTIPKELRYTIEQFNEQFPNDDACFETVAQRRYPNGMAHCEKCGTMRKHHRVTGRTAYACDRCGNHIFPLAGTIFQKTTTKLRLWFYAIYLMTSTRCGISAKQIQRETGVTYKTAWRMFRQIRSLLSEPDMQLGGSSLAPQHGVEVDEGYFGGRRKRGAGRLLRADRDQKTIVVGAVERKGRVVARVVPDATRETLHGIVKQYVLPSTIVFTDEHQSYAGLDEIPGKGYHHLRIKHEAKVYVMGQIHTQSIEGFWSLVKRGIGGVYHQVSQKYLQSYLNEYSFRYNRRDCGNLIFHDVLALAVQPLAVTPDPIDEKKIPETRVPF
jgi:transposase-like protein